MTKEVADALLVLAPGVVIRAGLQCPHCQRVLHPQPQWHSTRHVITWVYNCRYCGTVLDGQMRVKGSSLLNS